MWRCGGGVVVVCVAVWWCVWWWCAVVVVCGGGTVPCLHAVGGAENRTQHRPSGHVLAACSCVCARAIKKMKDNRSRLTDG
jgi:hypothetical protein